MIHHIAAIEMDWRYIDLLGGDHPEWVGDWFPYDVREEDGRLSPAPGFTLADHLARLTFVRDRLLAEAATLDEEAWRRSTRVDGNPSSPEWILHHLTQHEAEHRGQIQAIRTLLSS